MFARIGDKRSRVNINENVREGGEGKWFERKTIRQKITHFEFIEDMILDKKVWRSMINVVGQDMSIYYRINLWEW